VQNRLFWLLRLRRVAVWLWLVVLSGLFSKVSVADAVFV
jgi:hypothetical protein